MATEMDALSLSITASTRDAVDKIDNLIASLKNLDTRFRSLSGSTTYANNLETAVHSITRINNAISNIDDNKLKTVASALKSLGTAGNNLANFGSVTQAGKAMDSISAKAQNMAKSLAESFSIKDKDAINGLTSSIKTMMTTMGKGQAFYDAEKNVNEIIQDFGRFENKLYDVESTYEKVRQIIRSNPLYVPDNFSSNANWKSDLANIGIKNTTHDINAGVSAGQLASQLESLIPALRGIENESDIINTIADYLRNNATPAMISFKEASQQGAEAQHYVKEAVNDLETSLGIVIPTIEQLSQAIHSVNYDNLHGEEEMWQAEVTAIQQMRDSLQTATTALEGMGSAMQQTQQSAEPFDKIVQGLGQLEGVTIGDFSNISVLADGVNKLGYQSAINASQTLPLIADGLRQFENFTLPDLGDMDSFSRGLRSLGSKAVQNAASALPFIADGLKQLRNVGDLPRSEGLQEFAQSLSIFGRQTSERAVQTIPQLTQAFQRLFDTMSRAPHISQNTIDAANAMANLASRTGGVTRALNGANPALRTWTSNAGRATKSSFSLASAIGKVYATYWMLFRAFGMAGKAINIASDLTEVRNVVTQAFGDMAYKANEFAQTVGNVFGMSKLQALDAASRYQAMGKTMGITDRQVAQSNTFLKEKLSDTLALSEVQRAYGDLGTTAADMSINLTKLAGDLASLYNTDIDVAAEKLNSIFTGTTKPLREFGFDLTQATLQEWALTNGINANVKSMTQAEKAVLRYQYVMANASFVMGDFVRTADSWHNSIVAMKLAFSNLGSVIGQGFINLLKPAVQKITAFVNTITKLVEKAINAIGKLLGWQVEIDPVKALDSGGGDGIQDLQDAMDGAGGGADETADALDDADKSAADTAANLDKAQKAAKKMKDYLLGIDELNVFQPDTDTDTADKDKNNKDKKNKDKKGKSGSGSGGKGGGGASEGGATGGNVKFSKYESDINSWFELGKKIGDALSNAMEKIDWDKIYRKAENFGKNLASFLNGLISPRLFENVGKTIANSLNTALHFLDAFGKRFNWKNFGESIAAGINGFFKNFDFKLLASVLNTWALGLLDTLIVALKKTDWEKIGTQIGTFLVNIKWLAIGKKVVQAIWEAINAAFKVYKGMLKTAPLETAILSVVGGLKLFEKLKTIEWFAKLAKQVLAFNSSLMAGNSVLSTVNVLFPTLGNAIARVTQIYNIGAVAVGEFASSLKMGQGFVNASILGVGKLGDGINAFAASLSPLSKLIGGAFGGLVEILTVKDAIQSLVLGTQSLGASIAELAVGVGVAGAAFTLTFGFPVGLIATAVVGLVGAFAGLYSAVNQKIDEAQWEALGNAMSKPGGKPLTELTQEIKDYFASTTEGLDTIAAKSENLSQLRDNADETSQSIETIGRSFELTGELSETQIANLVSLMENLKNDTIRILGEERDVIITSIAGAFGDAVGLTEEEKGKLISATTGLEEATINELNAIQEEVDALNAEKEAAEASGGTLDDYTPRLIELYQKQAELTGKTNEAADASKNFQESIEGIDFSSLSTDEILEQMTQVGDSFLTTKETVNSSTDEMEKSFADYSERAKTLGNDPESIAFKNMADNAKTYGDNLNTTNSETLQTYYDNIQESLLNKIPGVMDEASKKYEDLKWYEKLFTTKESFVQEAVQKFTDETITPISEEIGIQMKDTLGVEGADYAAEAAQMIVDSLITTTETEWGNGETTLVQSLVTDVQGLIEQMTAKAKELGPEFPAGLMEGAKEYDFGNDTKEIVDNIVSDTESAAQINSPSKRMMPIGRFMMMGIIEGFKEKYSEITTAISTWFTKYVQPWFTIEKWSGLGKNIKDGIITQWNQFKTQWTTSIGNWWNTNVVPWFNLEKWKAEADHIKTAIITKFQETVSQWIIDIGNWWNQNVVPWLALSKWKTEADHIRDAIITKLTEMVSEWSSKISDWWKNYVEKYFNLDTWKTMAANIKTAIIGALTDTIGEWKKKVEELVTSFKEVFKESTFKEIGTKCMEAVLSGFKSVESQLKTWAQGVKDWIQNLWNSIVIKKPEADGDSSSSSSSDNSSKSKSKGKTSKKAGGGIFENGEWRNIHAYGSGGVPDEGQLFWARESGAELVGQIGGNTAVMNNDQIVASVANGVHQAVVEALAPYLSDISQNTRVVANKDFSVQIGDRQIAEANNRGQRQLGAVLFT